MIESGASLLPIVLGHPRPLRVWVLSLSEEDLPEMQRLLGTLELEYAGVTVVQLRKINPGTYVGKGKLAEIKASLESVDADALIVDVDLSPQQLRNIEKEVGGKPVVDRPGVILEIFSRHARTKEAKTQVELARVQYLLPRLAHFWSHFERQRGGGVGNRGMGEKQLEIDRRLLKNRITQLKKRLVGIREERDLRREGRRDVLQVALVGYTNAGKSTLLNGMTESSVLSKDQLFSTLDSCTRSLSPDSKPPIVAIDTVGFLSRIPTALIASFRSTLEEMHEADLILHVVDASSPKAKEQMQVTEEVLKELGLEDKPTMVVMNKIDLVRGGAQFELRALAPQAIRVSALDSESTRKLRETVCEHFSRELEVWEVMIPYTEPKMEALIRAHARIETKKYLEKGVFYRIRIQEAFAKSQGLEKFKVG